MDVFARHFTEAKKAGLGITLHIAEVLYDSSSFWNPGI